MDMLDKYLAAVAAQLPADQRDDIIAELRDLILSRFEDKEEALGRPLTDDEREDILREVGHPLVVAARYRKGPDSLIGPQLFPYWLFGVKAGLLILAGLSVLGLVISVIKGPSDFGQEIAQAFHGFFANGLTLIGVLTVVGAIMERQNIRPRWLTHWRVSDLPAFNLSDPGAWSAAMGQTGANRSRGGRTDMRLHLGGASGGAGRGWPGADYLVSFVFTGLFVLWWIGVVRFPGAEMMTFGHRGVTVTGAPIWDALYLPILFYALGQMAIDLASLARPHAMRMRAALQIAIACVGLWLTWAIWQAGHWFDVAADGVTARVEGGRGFLDLETLRDLSRGDNAELTIWATNLSGIISWVLAVIAFVLVWQVAMNLWRLAKPR